MESETTRKDDNEFSRDRRAVLLVLAASAPNPHDEVSGQSYTCPSAEDLAAFSDGFLDEEERANILLHLDRCPKCYKEVLGCADENVAPAH